MNAAEDGATAFPGEGNSSDGGDKSGDDNGVGNDGGITIQMACLKGAQDGGQNISGYEEICGFIFSDEVYLRQRGKRPLCSRKRSASSRGGGGGMEIHIRGRRFFWGGGNSIGEKGNSDHGRRVLGRFWPCLEAEYVCIGRAQQFRHSSRLFIFRACCLRALRTSRTLEAFLEVNEDETEQG